MNVKKGVARVLKAAGLFGVARTIAIRLGLHVPVPHGHSLLLEALQAKAIAAGAALAGQVCVEIGSTREQLPGQGSTADLARKCGELGMQFISVDMDPANTEGAAQVVAGINPKFQAVNAKGEEFLQAYQGRIDFLYLDAFDIDHELHSARRRERYQTYLGSDITNLACYKMHLDCVVEAVRLMPVGGEIVFDDAWHDGSGWAGKGHSAMPFLLDHGFSIVRTTKNTVWLRRVG